MFLSDESHVHHSLLRFGFSNNKRGNFGPPKWEDVLIKFNESNKKILINLKGI